MRRRRCGKTTYYEYKYTREFAKLIYNALSGANLHVTLYDQNYDLYQVMSGKKSGPIPNLKDYDYVLEIHFNATAVSGKDLKGDGNFKGVGMYINSGKGKNYTIDKNIDSWLLPKPDSRYGVAAPGFSVLPDCSTPRPASRRGSLTDCWRRRSSTIRTIWNIIIRIKRQWQRHWRTHW